MRKSLAVLLLLSAPGVLGQTVPPATLLDRGVAAYRGGDYVSAAVDLEQAAAALNTPAQLVPHETALVYLALAQFRLGDEEAARDTLLRIHAAEAIAPTFATLNLGPDVAEVETLAAALLPSQPLPRNVASAARQEEPPAPLPRVTPRQPDTTAAPPAPATTTPATDIAAARAAVERDTQRQLEEIRRQADERIAAARRAAEERVRAAEAEIAREADARIAEIRRAADARVAEARAAAERAVAAARTTPERVGEEPRTTTARATQESLYTLRDATAAADRGDIRAAVRGYTAVATAPASPREAIGEAAVGLYRTGAFREAVQAFRRFGAFARGEEDLRYYYAVALYETGEYAAAQKELACALPFIQVTDDVARYRLKIENTVAVTGSM